MRSIFKVTEDLVKKLLSLIDGGLVDGAGSAEGEGGSVSGVPTFCVQQAVNLATGRPDDDDDASHCVMEWVNNLGIQFNDSSVWDSDESRAAGLREFAIAELGSSGLRENSFRKRLIEKVKTRWPDEEDGGVHIGSSTSQLVNIAETDGEVGLLALIQMTVETLKEMGSPGCDYLCMANKKKYERPPQLEGVRLPTIKPATNEMRKSAWLGEDAPWE